jgi:hypothetical protein
MWLLPFVTTTLASIHSSSFTGAIEGRLVLAYRSSNRPYNCFRASDPILLLMVSVRACFLFPCARHMSFSALCYARTG